MSSRRWKEEMVEIDFRGYETDGFDEGGGTKSIRVESQNPLTNSPQHFYPMKLDKEVKDKSSKSFTSGFKGGGANLF